MKKSHSFRLVLLGLIIAICSVGCGGAPKALSAGSSLFKSLESNPNLSMVTSLLKTPGLNSLMGSSVKGPFTLLAPTNDAFNALPPATLESLKNPANVQQVASLLKNNIVPGKLDAASIENGGITNAAGNPLSLKGANLGSIINSDNANIIPIDKVLIN
jgi:uncharacterized surface protein with fasciclin (FAS1) repeats